MRVVVDAAPQLVYVVVTNVALALTETAANIEGNFGREQDI